MYYKCTNNQRYDYICKENQSFNYQLQTCVKKGLCYDPVCTGLVNGEYPDTTQECLRSFECSGGKIVATQHCGDQEIFSADLKQCIPGASSVEMCQLPQKTAVAFPIQQRSNLCAKLSDGVYLVPNSECREYFICKSKINLGTLSCADNYVFNGSECLPPEFYQCKDPGCGFLSDGLHVDLYSECQDFFYCDNHRLSWRNSCPTNTIHNGDQCVSQNDYKCPTITPETFKCLHKPDGYYRNDASCNEFYYCSEGQIMFKNSCPNNQLWNGHTCVEPGWFFCEPPKYWIGCLVKDGYYADTSITSQCTNYHYCSNGLVTRYACPPTESFDGEKCIPKALYQCPVEAPIFTSVCGRYADGFFVYPGTNCQRYKLCRDGNLIKDFVCPENEVFNGVDRCVKRSCRKVEEKFCYSNGFFQDLDSGCKSYYFCIERRKTVLECPYGQIFDGQICVSETRYKCPESCDVYKSCVN